MTLVNAYIIQAEPEYLGLVNTKHRWDMHVSLFSALGKETRIRTVVESDAKTKLSVHKALCALVAAINVKEALPAPVEQIPGYVGKTFDATNANSVVEVA